MDNIRSASSFPRPPRPTGMTLLEVILAITALASITTLVASLWGQMRDWTSENASHHVALQRERTLALFNEQWDTRVLTVSLGDLGAPAVTFDPKTLTFITTTPIFFHQAPMARVVYHVVKEGGALLGQSAAYHLEYEESPVWSPISAARSPAARTSQPTRRLTLFDQADELRFERWLDEADEPRPDRPSLRVGWFVLQDELEIQSQQANNNEGQTTPDSAQAQQPTQIADQDSSIPWRAGRLVGAINGDPFAWQFLAGPSR